MNNKTRVIVVYGGKSAEHEISCRSAAFVLKNLDSSKYDVQAIAIDKQGQWLHQDIAALMSTLSDVVAINSSTANQTALPISRSPGKSLLGLSENGEQKVVVFPVLHGTNGEDGTIQGLFELANVAYVGPDHLGSAIGMDKVVAKKLVQAAGLPVVPWVDVRRQKWDLNSDQVLLECESLNTPVFVKPVNCGSSVGITKVTKREDLRKAIDYAFKFDSRVMVEIGLDVREIECAVMGDYDPEVSLPGEIAPTAEFYTYDAKYVDAEGAKIKVPADLDLGTQKKAQKICKAAFIALELYGMARVDLFLDKKSGEFFFNEVNTIPGFTEISQFPLLWIHSGMSPSAILDRLIDLGLKRQECKEVLQTSI